MQTLIASENLNVALRTLSDSRIKKPLFLIFDRDGTLVPISDSPDSAALDPAVIQLISKLSCKNKDHVAVVSARGLNCLAQDFTDGNIVLAGNYGLEIAFPGGLRFLHSAAAFAAAHICELESLFSSWINYDSDLLLDKHRYSLCLHFHRLGIQERARLHLRMQELEQSFPTLVFRRLATSYEVLPPCRWDKGNALDEITKHLLLDTEPTYVVFGDSEADEPMFNWVNERQGFSFNIGYRSHTNARACLESPKELVEFLVQLM